MSIMIISADSARLYVVYLPCERVEMHPRITITSKTAWPLSIINLEIEKRLIFQKNKRERRD
jgi:hypothetical protein